MNVKNTNVNGEDENNKGNVWAVIVSVGHKKVANLVKQAIAIGIIPTQIIVVTNRDNKSTLMGLGVQEENILAKDSSYTRAQIAGGEKPAEKIETVGYAGALIKGAQRIVQYNTSAAIINMSAAFGGNLVDIGDLIWSAANAVCHRRTGARIIGAVDTEAGISIWKAETIMTAVSNGGLRMKGTTFKDLMAELSPAITILA